MSKTVFKSLGSKEEFFKEHNIIEENFNQTELTWDFLEEIYDDYLTKIENYKIVAEKILNELNPIDVRIF